ncbi:MAG: PD-(D/E)XK nuclease family transposase, partial [Lachnospiraceae bacterium]|nr:PD-(D/E)XK nuclease family transposase [Lachnospiraceae bacterium]
MLDVKVLLNNDTIINLEMQVVNEHDWPERSLSYLCRSFDNLNQGEPYRNVKSVVQIGLLDFTLFPENPE